MLPIHIFENSLWAGDRIGLIGRVKKEKKNPCMQKAIGQIALLKHALGKIEKAR